MTSHKRTDPPAGVVIVEPVGIVRASLQMLFSAESDIEVLGESDDAETAFDIVCELKSHARTVVLLALELSGEKDSFWLIRSIRDRFPQMTIIATGTDLDRGAISQALFVGADGFVHKNSAPDRYIEATRRAAAGELVLEGLPRGALGGIVDGFDQQRSTPTLLTERELMVLEVAAEGVTAREIGRRLGVRERTVTTHLNHIYRKLGANGRVSALSTALRLGMLALPEAESSSAIAVS
jgi:DNA-binding NarL/FixJ family response regulator